MRRPTTVGAGALAAGLMLVLATPVTALAAGPTTGADVSYPQCGRALVGGADFAVVGVNAGTATTTNPCLGEQLAWAASTPGTGRARVEVYVNTADPGPKKASWWPSADRTRGGEPARSPYGRCSGAATRACAWVYGASLAADDLQQRGVPASAAHRWWLDVEVANSWSGSTARNRAVLEGMATRLQHAGQRVGLYALDHEFRDLIGTVPAGSVLAPLPSWIAGAAGATAAARRCGGDPLARGRVELVQWIGADPVGPIDQDLACAVLRGGTAAVTGRAAVGAVLTAEVHGWPTGPTRTYRWTRDGTTVPGATHRTYRPAAVDRGHRIAVVVTAGGAGYSRAERTAPARRVG